MLEILISIKEVLKQPIYSSKNTFFTKEFENQDPFPLLIKRIIISSLPTFWDITSKLWRGGGMEGDQPLFGFNKSPKKQAFLTYIDYQITDWRISSNRCC